MHAHPHASVVLELLAALALINLVSGCCSSTECHGFNWYTSYWYPSSPTLHAWCHVDGTHFLTALGSIQVLHLDWHTGHTTWLLSTANGGSAIKRFWGEPEQDTPSLHSARSPGRFLMCLPATIMYAMVCHRLLTRRNVVWLARPSQDKCCLPIAFVLA